jgi:hypothetical protein
MSVQGSLETLGQSQLRRSTQHSEGLLGTWSQPVSRQSHCSDHMPHTRTSIRIRTSVGVVGTWRTTTARAGSIYTMYRYDCTVQLRTKGNCVQLYLKACLPRVWRLGGAFPNFASWLRA